MNFWAKCNLYFCGRSAEPVMYLGFPLCSSQAQLEFSEAQLLEFVRNGCQLHVRRNLSVRDRATVLNCLLLSRIWHVLRVTAFPKTSFMAKLQTICSTFLLHHMYPPVRFSILCRPRDTGGLGILDPSLNKMLYSYDGSSLSYAANLLWLLHA
ncbi:hypothetical protein BX666DRAFT_2048970 [Dichotomocladium elegans]|nr:hypothetical protein BX666DRAFT_2048970 [Dichotomocladium elegans]